MRAHTLIVVMKNSCTVYTDTGSCALYSFMKSSRKLLAVLLGTSHVALFKFGYYTERQLSPTQDEQETGHMLPKVALNDVTLTVLEPH